MKKRMWLTALCLVLIAAVSVAGTYAWFSSQLKNADNSLRVGSLEIKLFEIDGSTETDVSSSKVPLFEDDNLFPGSKLEKTLEVRSLCAKPVAVTLTISFKEDADSLSDKLVFRCNGNALEKNADGKFVVLLSEQLAASGKIRFTLGAEFPDGDASGSDNAYQGTECSFDVTVNATQLS